MKILTATLTSLLLSTATSSPTSEQQRPLNPNDDRFELIRELKKAEIIPTVLDPFHPYLALSVSWGKKVIADVGNTIKPKRVQKPPTVHFLDSLPSPWTTKEHPQLTVALTDPDARSRDNPDWSEMCHWIATDVPLSTVGSVDSVANFTDVIPYKAPGPPPKTGKHRYVFAALAPINGTYERLNLTVPADRQHWGYGKERTGLREWAADNGLTVIGGNGANFIYAQHNKQ